MRRKSSKQLFSVLMAATMVMSGISIPVNAPHLKVGKSISTKAGSFITEM